ncbi:hypothetical protein ACIHAA_30810 [Streptomyces sp. NPDC052040]|uniref:hypothetical protein n=1 Tax=unclassified Streptomyces TaxID=2593676 RepID=UPI0037D41BE3
MQEVRTRCFTLAVTMLLSLSALGEAAAQKTPFTDRLAGIATVRNTDDTTFHPHTGRINRQDPDLPLCC